MKHFNITKVSPWASSRLCEDIIKMTDKNQVSPFYISFKLLSHIQRMFIIKSRVGYFLLFQWMPFKKENPF